MEFYTQTPEPPNKPCLYLRIFLTLCLSYGIYVISAGVWFLYNWYYAVSALLLSFVFMGIIRSKLLHASIPKVQQEFTYSDSDIVSWYLHLYLCPSKTS